MNALRFLSRYLKWHYTDAFVDLHHIARNYLWGIGHVFSVHLLFRTLFVPWHRLGSHTTTFFKDPFDYLGDVLVNLTMRLLGFFVRSILLILAGISTVFITAAFLAIAILWGVLPLLVLSLLIRGFSLLPS